MVAVSVTLKPGPFRALTPYLLLGVTQFAFAVLGWCWAHFGGVTPAILPGLGIATAGMMLGGRRLWPAAAVGLVASLLFNPLPTPLYVPIAVISDVLVGSLLGACVIERMLGRFPFAFSNRAVSILVAVCIASALVVTSVSLVIIYIGNGTLPRPVPVTFAEWLLRYALGSILVMPLILSWSQAHRDQWSPARIAHLMIALGLVAGLSVMLFLAGEPYPTGWLLFPATVWASLAFQVRGAASAMAILAVIGIIGTQSGLGPFHAHGREADMVTLQFFLIVCAATLLFLAALADGRRAEEKLRRYDAKLRGREAQLALFLHNAPAPIAIFDREMRYVATSHRYLVDFDLPLARPLAGLLHYEVFPHIPQNWREMHRRALEGEEFSADEEVLPRGEGRVDYVRWDLKPWYDDNRRITGVVIYCEVITKAVEARRRVEAAEGQYRAVFEQAEVGVVRTSLRGHYIEANDRACAILGRSRKEVLGTRFEAITYPDDAPADITAMHDMLAGRRRSYATEKRMVMPDGSLKWVNLTASPVRNADGAPDCFVAVMYDVTAVRAAQEELRDAHEKLLRVSRLSAMGAMASTLAHELNQPLAEISNYAEACRRMVEPDSGTADKMLIELLKRTAGEALRAGDIIRKMRRFTISGEITRQPEELHAIIDDACAAVHGRSSASGVRILRDFDSRVRLVPADRLQIEQVLANLIANALEATQGRPDRRVAIDTRRKRDAVIVSVADNGDGLPEGMRDNLFEPFRTTKEKGTGLGLPICRTIVEAHGGQIWAEQSRDGGAVVKFTLPLLMDPQTECRDAV